MNIEFCDAPAKVPPLHEIIREEIHAAGPISRQWLHERVVTRSDRPRDEVSDAVEDLLRAGDLLSGHGRVGPAPLRAVPLPDGEALLLGARPGRWLSVETTDGLPRRVKSIPEEATEVRLAAWTGLDRTPTADAAFLGDLERRDVEDDDLDWSDAYEWRDGRFRPDPENAGLWRLRMPGMWFRYAWFDEQGQRPLTASEGLRAAFAIARGTGGTTVAVDTADGVVTIKLPRLPRPEYRLIVACALRGTDWTWRVPSARWPEVRDTLAQRLGLLFEESDGEA